MIEQIRISLRQMFFRFGAIGEILYQHIWNPLQEINAEMESCKSPSEQYERTDSGIDLIESHLKGKIHRIIQVIATSTNN